ncbi:MAG: hypothetical protein IT429_23085 [Gemmataceae bacterium]|nr:hypothetical protein [Gemmataceae bacterium]
MIQIRNACYAVGARRDREGSGVIPRVHIATRRAEDMVEVRFLDNSSRFFPYPGWKLFA